MTPIAVVAVIIHPAASTEGRRFTASAQHHRHGHHQHHHHYTGVWCPLVTVLPEGTRLMVSGPEVDFLWLVVVQTTTLAFFPLFIVLENQLENCFLPDMALQPEASGFSTGISESSHLRP